MNKEAIVNYIVEQTRGYNGSYESWLEDYCGCKTRQEKEKYFKKNFDCHGNTIVAVCRELNIRY